MKIIISILSFLIGLFSGKAYSQSDPAKERFEEYTKGLNITEKKEESFNSNGVVVKSYAAKVEDQKISEIDVSGDQIDEIQRAISYAPKFVEMYAGYTNQEISPKILDTAFSNWRANKQNSPFDDESAIFIVGATFGEYCSRHLNMKWVVVDDAFGQDLAVRFKKKAVYVYPFSIVEKRIDTPESGFLYLAFLQFEHISKDPSVKSVEPTK